MTKAANLASLGSVVTVPTGDAPSYQCRAWVNFNGTGTVAIRGSGNVSSITDRGVGLYTANLTTAMPDANYSAVAIGNSWAMQCSPSTASAVFVEPYRTDTQASLDITLCSLAIFR